MLFKLLSPVFGRFFSARWHCRMLCVLLVFFLFPAGILAGSVLEPLFKWPRAPYPDFMGEIPAPLADFLLFSAPENAERTQANGVVDLWMLLAVLWICAAL
ncbi:MAG: hypothetical protein LBV27_07945, partial [Oscillospiraceae bacterium]|nr:hypothetical protein [Oscillospiraceae bacterium]